MRIEREHAALLALHDDLAPLLDWPEERLFGAVVSVSRCPAGGHLDHVLLVNGAIARQLTELADGTSRRARRGGRPNLGGWAALHLRWLPRGVGEAPAAVVPDKDLDVAGLRAHLARTRTAVEALAPRLAALAQSRERIAHQALGAFDAAQWLRFACVHTRHHAKIIADIDRAH